MTLQDFVNAGIAVIPVLPRTKVPEVHWRTYQSRLPSKTEMDRWFRPGRPTNAAVVCGWKGLTVIDLDTRRDYVLWTVWAMTAGSVARRVMLDTYRVRTSRGVHVYLFIEDTPRCGRFRHGDIKGKGGYVLIPPSVHPSGARYTAIDEHAAILSVQSLDEVIPNPPEPPLPPLPPLKHVYPMSSLWPRTVVEEIRETRTILSMFPEARATGGNRWYMAKCPFHPDQHESMWIDAESGICGCYAGCTPKPLDVIGLYGRLHNLDNKAAIRELAGA